MDILQRNIDITHLSNYKTPALTEWYFEISNSKDVDKIPEIVSWAHMSHTKILWISGGTNMLFAFDTFQ